MAKTPRSDPPERKPGPAPDDGGEARNPPFGETREEIERGPQAKDLLDLDKWEEREGYGSSRAPICPHCGQEIDPKRVTENDLIHCPNCRQASHCIQQETPVGPAWQTWPRERKKP